MKLHPFVQSVASLKFENCFNPYRDTCTVYDQEDAASRRATALSSIIKIAESASIDALWIGRDLGYRGGRRTGLALTDDIHLAAHTQRWNVVADRATLGSPMAERTAAMVWKVLNQIDAKIFLWNVFPLHPHQIDEPFTNRQHNPRERRAGEEALRDLIGLLRPLRVIAIGNDAEAAAQRVRIVPVVYVRHPSYGGQSEFIDQISALYQLSDATPKLI